MSMQCSAFRIARISYLNRQESSRHISVAVPDDFSVMFAGNVWEGVTQYGLHSQVLAVFPIEAEVIVDAVRRGGLRWKILSEQGRRYAGRLSWLDIAGRCIQLYRSVLAQRHAGAV